MTQNIAFSIAIKIWELFADRIIKHPPNIPLCSQYEMQINLDFNMLTHVAHMADEQDYINATDVIGAPRRFAGA